MFVTVSKYTMFLEQERNTIFGGKYAKKGLWNYRYVYGIVRGMRHGSD
jgi:hypothetical protein